MTDVSKSQLKAAVSAIMQRDKSEPAPSRMPQRAHLSALRRTHHERLQSEFAKAGFDFSRLEKLYNEYKEMAGKLLEKQIPRVDSKPVKPTKSDQEWTDNKQRVYELIAGRPLVTFPLVIDTPVAIYSVPSSSLVDSHIESWNSWATWDHRDAIIGSNEGRMAFLKFLFAWQNNSPNPVVIKNASADISTRGFCEAEADPKLLESSLTQLFFSVYHRAHVGTTGISGDDRIILNIFAWTDGYLFGGYGDLRATDIDRLNHVRCQDIVVPGGRVAIFEIGVSAYYHISSGFPYGGGEGKVVYLFASSGRRIACPALVLELNLVVQS